MLIEVKMPSFEGVAAGQTATAKLPIGRRYHELNLVYGGTFTVSQMNEIRIIANAKVIQRFSGDQRDTMNQFDGLAAASGVLTIPLTRRDLKTRAGEELTALNTGVQDKNGMAITSLHVEIDIDGAATSPTLQLYATQSDPIPGGPGTVMHIKQYTRSPAGSGEYDISDLPFGGAETQALNRLFMNSSAITSAKVERGGYVIFERDSTLNDKIQTDNNRTPQTNWFVVDPSERGYGGAPIDLVGYTDFRVKPTVSGATSIVNVVEYLGSLGQ